MAEKEYIEKDKPFSLLKNYLKKPNGQYNAQEVVYLVDDLISAIPAADVVEVRQIRAFIDKLIAERDKYDLHSMRWEHYDCDRLLIEQMLDEIDGERKGGDE